MDSCCGVETGDCETGVDGGESSGERGNGGSRDKSGSRSSPSDDCEGGVEGNGKGDGEDGKDGLNSLGVDAAKLDVGVEASDCSRDRGSGGS